MRSSRKTTTNICGSELHMFEGRTDVSAGTVLGHENIGIVEEVGRGVVPGSELTAREVQVVRRGPDAGRAALRAA